MPYTKEFRAEYMRARRARLKAQGLCQHCGQLEAEPQRTLCSICLEDRRTREHARYERRKAIRAAESVIDAWVDEQIHGRPEAAQPVGILNATEPTLLSKIAGIFLRLLRRAR